MEKNNESGKNKIIETYAEDMTKILEDDKSGLIKKIIHEQEVQEIEKKNLSPESTKNKIFAFLGSMLILLSFGTLFYFILKEDIPTTVSTERRFMSLIFHDASSFIEVKNLEQKEIIQNIFNTVSNTKVKSGGIEGIYLTVDKEFIGLRDFIARIKGNLVLNNDLVDDNFLLGVVNGTQKDFFILLKTYSVPDIFEPLRAWEKKMFFDLHKFFGKEISPETKFLLTADFEDGVVKNKNARILYDENRNIIMIYVFANDNSVIITNTESAAEEIMLRLSYSRTRK